MELTLNLVWVCVAIAGIAVLIATMSPAMASSGLTASAYRKIVAMSCALVILFFVISMTDDLHDQALLLEESKLARVAVEARTSANPTSERLISPEFLAFVPPAFVLPPPPSWRRLLADCDSPFAPNAVRGSFRGRAPPSFLV